MSRFALLPLSLLVYTACASSEAAPSQTAKAQPASSTGDYQSVCVDSMTRNRTCTDDYIPALVDSRARMDKPAGIAEAVKTDRAGVIAKAKEEWASDSTDENIARNCQAMTEHMDDSMKPMDAARKVLKANPQLLGPWLTGVTTIDGKDGLAAVKAELGL